MGVVGACGSEQSQSNLDWVPAEYRALASQATGFERDALADGRVTQEEVVEGVRRQAQCLVDLGYVARADALGQIAVEGEVPPSDEEWAACAKGNAEVISIIHDLETYGDPDVQRQRSIDCLIELGDLASGATAADFSQLMEEWRAQGHEPTPAQADCLAAAHDVG